MSLSFGKCFSGIRRGSVQAETESPPDVFLEAALSEIEEGRVDRVTWAGALSRADGDGSRAKVLYMRLRGQVFADQANEEAKLLEKRRVRQAELDSALIELGNTKELLCELKAEASELKGQLPDNLTTDQQKQLHPIEMKLLDTQERMIPLIQLQKEHEAVCSGLERRVNAVPTRGNKKQID